MLRIFAVSFFLMITMSCFAQDSTQIMSPEAFSRLVKRDISYAILGDKSPTQGVKVDLSDPKINMNATLFSKRRHLLASDFEGKINDGKFTLFDKNKFNSIFSLGLSYHLILNNNAYKWQGTKGDLELTKLRIKTEKEKKIISGRDKEYLAMLIAAKTNINPLDISIVEGVQKNNAKSLGFEEEEVNHKEALALSAKYFNKIDPSIDNFYILLSKIRTDTSIVCNLSKLIDDYNTTGTKIEKSDEELLDYEIDLMKKFWTTKKLHWISFYSNISYQKYMTYDESLANLQTNYATAGNILLTHYNMHIIAPDYILYLRAGAGLALGNNLSDFKRRDYTKIDTLENLPGTIYIEETKGVAYFTDGAAVRFFPQPKVDFELYFVPFRKSVFSPGIFLRMGAKLGQNISMPSEFGIVFNVQSKVKDRNFFSILPFFNFDDLLSIDSDNAFNGVKNWKFGFRVGLPISVLRTLK